MSKAMQGSACGGKPGADKGLKGIPEEESGDEDDGFQPLYSYESIFDKPATVPSFNAEPKAKTPRKTKLSMESPKHCGRWDDGGKSPAPTPRRGKAKDTKPSFELLLSDSESDEEEGEEDEDAVLEVKGGWGSEKGSKKCSSSQGGKEDEDDDLLPPPPPIRTSSGSLSSDPTLAAIRQRRAALAQVPLNASHLSKEVEATTLAQARAKALMEEEAALAARAKASLLRNDSSGAGSSPSVAESSSGAPESSAAEGRVREKVRLVVQSEDENREMFSICKDDKLEKLFTAYKKKLSPQKASNCIFKFDGERIDPSMTAASLDMEDEDMIEVVFRK